MAHHNRMRHVCLLLFIVSTTIPLLSGCRNPAQSSLPPGAIADTMPPLPPLPKGDIYADETVPTAETPIDVGDTLDVIIRRGAGRRNSPLWSVNRARCPWHSSRSMWPA